MGWMMIPYGCQDTFNQAVKTRHPAVPQCPCSGKLLQTPNLRERSQLVCLESINTSCQREFILSAEVSIRNIQCEFAVVSIFHM